MAQQQGWFAHQSLPFETPPVTMSDLQTFAALEQNLLTDMSGSEWDAYYITMKPWLLNANADIRKRAIDRLCTAVFFAKRHSYAGSHEGSESHSYNQYERIAWLLDAVDAAHAHHADIIPLCLNHLKYQGSGDAQDPVTLWLERMSKASPAGVDPGMIEGTILLRQAFDEDDPTDVARRVALLDHPSNYVRACAARSMSVLEGDALNAADMFALIKEKEILRPGIAGPYWSEWGFCREDVPIDPIEWMMDILERRSGPEPNDMSFNGIDFYLHEICDHSPEMVLRMMKGGHFNLALETATESNGVVPGMEPVLRQLADHSDHNIRNRSQFHLAHHYRFLHPEAEERGVIQRWPNWSPDAEVFSFHYGENNALWFITVYPRDVGGHFADTLAWSLMNKAMPPDLRGDIDFHPMDFSKESPPTPYRSCDKMMWRFTSGATLEMRGDPDDKIWSRIDIGGAHLGKSWNPFKS
jgi:hypothetical protein